MRNRYYLFIFVILLAGCKSQAPLNGTSPVKGEIEYSAIYLIHADADYLYHDEDGNRKRADEKVLEEAISVGKKAKSGEVFIYHLKPERKILWLFPRKDRRLIHYRNGELITDRKYSPEIEEDLFREEIDYYRKNRAHSFSHPEQILLYFGHEIPPKSTSGYYHSIPKIKIDAHSFSESIQPFLTNGSESFDLTVLSTCNNGTPQMANALSGLSRFLLASPQNLHLSHIDTESLLLLENEPAKIQKVATQMAENTFQRMSEELHTAITLTLYNLEKVNPYMNHFYDDYRAYLSDLEYRAFQDNIDCTKLPVFQDLESLDGLSRWYRPARFGRGANTQVHSGWGCKDR